MEYSIKNNHILKAILLADTLLGGGTAIIGLLLLPAFSMLFNLPETLLLIVYFITLVYAFVAFKLTIQKPISIPLLRTLVYANWFWTAVSFTLALVYFSTTTYWGKGFLILQIIVVGTLAYLEGAQIKKQH